MEDGKFEYLSAVDGDPGNLIKGLQMVQSREGYVSDDAVKAVSEHFSTPVVEVEGVLGFYAQFKRVKPGKYRISMCDGTACHIKGSPLVREWLRQELGIDSGETTEDGMFSLETVACLGCCSLAPVISINGRVHARLTRKSLASILAKYRKEAAL
ncbi:MAG: NAD(P)H-dependent oxidoreductase subunit E [Victivallaceae bacterium]|nr:NAD(P)H-dependent oxidoreductase subunit E [Victivallaceae bacterium]